MTAPREISWSHRGRIPSLDGIRAVSIAFVLVAHTIGTGLVPMNARMAGVAGDLGVRAFFVLSGFLITTLLVRELDARGTISLLSFYLRRSFRIFPAFYAYLIVLAVLALTGAIVLRDNDLLAAASYTTNFHADRSWWTGHLWSLAVEEQFYVLWPLVLVTLGLVRAWQFAIVAVLAAPMLRVALWHLWPEQRALADQVFPCVFDAVATGCLLAFAAPRLGRSSRVARIFDSRWFWPASAACLMPLAIRQPDLRYGLAMTLANLAIAAVILRCVARPDSAVSRVLERRPLVWLGSISYSLYVWQQLFLDRHSSAWIHEFPLNLVAAFAAAIACHYAVERPFLKLSARSSVARQPAALSALGRPHAVLDVSGEAQTPLRARHSGQFRAPSHADT